MFFQMLTQMAQVFYGMILESISFWIIIIRMCFKSVTETETKPESNNPTGQQIRKTPQPVMWKPDQNSAVLPDLSESENSEVEKDKLSLGLSKKEKIMIKPDINIGNVASVPDQLYIAQQKEVQLLHKHHDDLKMENDNNKLKSKPEGSMKKLRQNLPERGGKLRMGSQPFPCTHENSNEKQFDLNTSAEEIDRLEEMTSPISNDPVNEKKADKVEGEESSPSISKEREQPSQSEKETNKGYHKKPNKFSVYFKKIQKKVKKIRQKFSEILNENKEIFAKIKKMIKKKKEKKKRLFAVQPIPKTEKMEAFFITLKKLLALFKLDENCSMTQVKRAYKDMALKYHPDRHMELTESDRQQLEDVFKSYKEVYDLIIECWP
jgi:hypothetical protein